MKQNDSMKITGSALLVWVVMALLATAVRFTRSQRLVVVACQPSQ